MSSFEVIFLFQLHFFFFFWFFHIIFTKFPSKNKQFMMKNMQNSFSQSSRSWMYDTILWIRENKIQSNVSQPAGKTTVQQSVITRRLGLRPHACKSGGRPAARAKITFRRRFGTASRCISVHGSSTSRAHDDACPSVFWCEPYAASAMLSNVITAISGIYKLPPWPGSEAWCPVIIKAAAHEQQ